MHMTVGVSVVCRQSTKVIEHSSATPYLIPLKQDPSVNLQLRSRDAPVSTYQSNSVTTMLTQSYQLSTWSSSL